jgi:teichuronic acid biosynthesis glycosyltransferase TuaG
MATSAENPLVSVIMAAYNVEKYIESAIISVLNQTYKNLELLIVDDCSTDNTLTIAKKYEDLDKRVHVFTNLKNFGVSYTRNKAAKNAKGNQIAFLDSDDCWERDKLSKQVNLMKQTNCTICYTGSKFMNEDGELYANVLKVPTSVSYEELLRGNVISCSSAMVEASVFKSILMHDDSCSEDYVAWLTVLKLGYHACGINEPLLIYRYTNNSKSSNRFRAAKMTYRSYRSIEISIKRSAYYTIRYAIYSLKKHSSIKIPLLKKTAARKINNKTII